MLLPSVWGRDSSPDKVTLGLESADKPASTSSQGPGESKELVSEW